MGYQPEKKDKENASSEERERKDTLRVDSEIGQDKFNKTGLNVNFVRE